MPLYYNIITVDYKDLSNIIINEIKKVLALRP